MENREGYAHGNGELGDDSWTAGEVAGCEFMDARLGKRLGNLLHQISGSIGGTVPLACQDWASTKAAYRFFSNERVDEGAILAGHFQATRERAQASSGYDERIGTVQAELAAMDSAQRQSWINRAVDDLRQRHLLSAVLQRRAAQGDWSFGLLGEHVLRLYAIAMHGSSGQVARRWQERAGYLGLFEEVRHAPAS